jgi:voltage-gated potassium channel
LRPKTRPNLRQRLDELLQPYRGNPSQPRTGLWIDVTLVLAILASCAAVVVEHLTDAAAHPLLHQILLVAEATFTVLFTLEYLLRWYASPNRWRYPFTVHALIDLIAILPSILMFAHVMGIGSEFLVLRTVRLLRTLRLLRMLRLLRILRHGYSIYRLAVIIRIWTTAIVYQYRLGRVARLLLLSVLAWVAGANALHLIERVSENPTHPSPYASDYWETYWGVIVFIISGMDAPEPVSLGARVVVTTLLVAGICIVAVFTGEVVSILVRTEQRRGRMALKPPGLRLAEHIVILGRNDHLEKIIHQIHRAFGGRHYILVVCEEAETLPSPGPLTHRRVFALQGNPARDDVLDAANIEDARRVIVLSGDVGKVTPSERDDVALMHALAAVARNRAIPLVVELQEPESLRYASSIKTADCLVSRHFGEMLMSQSVHNGGVAEIYDELMTFSADTSEFYRVRVPSQLVGRTFRQAQEFFLDLDTESIVPVGIDGPGAHAYRDFRLCVADGTGRASLADHVLTDSDHLIVCAFDRPSFDMGKPEMAWHEIPRS